MTQSQNNWPFIINVGNSIIGVTVLAMPFCFKTCGIILGTLLLLFSTWLTIVSCGLLMKAGITSRRRSYSMLAYFTLGSTGKLIVEIGMIGLQLGTLVAQIVIIGDLGPGIVSKAIGIRNSDNLRTGLILFLCLFVGLPLGLLKDVRALSKTSTMCIMFYTFFSFYVVLMSIPKLVAGDWYSKVNFWRMEGFFQCLPIFSFAFGCQTQLFITYDALAEPSLKRINAIVGSAVNMCTVSYLLVGFFGYIAFCDIEELSGDIINHFKENMMSDALKMCFVFSIAVSIPLIVFPCRLSLYTMCFPHKFRGDDVPGSWKMPEFHFKVITVIIIVGSMIIGILIPNIEFVLGLNGATTGTLICYIFPALFFLNVMSEKAEGKLSGRMVLAFGLTIMIASTYTTLSAQNSVDTSVAGLAQPIIEENVLRDAKAAVQDMKKDDALVVNKSKFEQDSVIEQDGVIERHEPPIPQEPVDEKIPDSNNDIDGIKAKEKDTEQTRQIDKPDIKNEKEIIDKDTKSKEEKSKEEANVKDLPDVAEKEIKVIEEKQIEAEKKQNEILAKLEQQQQQQEIIIQEQKEILEQLKEHNDKHKDEDSPQVGGDVLKLADEPSNKNDIAQPNDQLKDKLKELVNAQDRMAHGIVDNQMVNQGQQQGGGVVNGQQVLKQEPILGGGQQLLQQQPNEQPLVGDGQQQVIHADKQLAGLPNGQLQQNIVPLNQDIGLQNVPLKQDSGLQNAVLKQDSDLQNPPLQQNLLNQDNALPNAQMQQNNLPLKQNIDLKQDSKDGFVLKNNDNSNEQGLQPDIGINVHNNHLEGGALQNNIPPNVEHIPNKAGNGVDNAAKKEELIENIDKVKHRGKRDAGDDVVDVQRGDIDDNEDGDGLGLTGDIEKYLHDNIKAVGVEAGIVKNIRRR